MLRKTGEEWNRCTHSSNAKARNVARMIHESRVLIRGSRDPRINTRTGAFLFSHTRLYSEGRPVTAGVFKGRHQGWLGLCIVLEASRSSK